MAVNVQADPRLVASDLVTNDFAIVAATVNGSGSQTANATIIRTLFKMGIPVNGKNLFPSNIYGLPTWYTIRVSKDGYIARRDDFQVLAALNPETQAEDIQKLSSGGLVVHPEEWKLKPTRQDITYYSMPVARMVKEANVEQSLREYVANMVYVGALAALLDFDMGELRKALEYQFSGKKKAIDLNWGVLEKAYDYARQNYGPSTRFRVERMSGTDGKILIEGNAAAALGAIFGGVSVVSWYPITPSTSLVDALRKYAKELRTDPVTGESTCVVVQAEDELSAIGMVLGANWVGARAMSSTSGPGLSLMSEFAGLSYFAEVPAVIWDIQRMGPSTGLPTRVAQGDVLKAYYLSHGDTRHIVLLPATMQECFEFGWKAFDLADRLQTLVLCLSDLDLGMNLWMSDSFEYPDKPFDRGKVKTWEELKQSPNGGFARYKDVDGDGIGYRTLPSQGPAYFARGTGHTEQATYSERPDDWLNNLKRLDRKHDTARKLVPQPVEDTVANAKIGIISYGSNNPGVVEARDLLAKGGLTSSYHRIRALPLGESTREFLKRYERVYVIESNQLGQMANLLRLEFPELATRVIARPHCDGLPLTARLVADLILEVEKER